MCTKLIGNGRRARQILNVVLFSPINGLAQVCDVDEDDSYELDFSQVYVYPNNLFLVIHALYHANQHIHLVTRRKRDVMACIIAPVYYRTKYL